MLKVLLTANGLAAQIPYTALVQKALLSNLSDSNSLANQLSGTTPQYTVTDAEGQLRAAILTSMAACLGSSDVAFLDMAANQEAFSAHLKQAIEPTFTSYGLELTTFYLQSLSLPEEVQARLDRASSMRIVGDLKQYTQFEAAEALKEAAANPGGIAGAGAGLGAGLAMAQAIGGAMNPAASPAPGAESDPVAMIERLGGLLQKGILTQAEFDAKKAELLRQIR